MKVLGIDPGTRVVGYGVVVKGAGGKLTYTGAGEIKVAATKPLAERLLVISDALDRVFAEFEPDVVAVESVFYSKNVKTAIVMSHMRGVALLKAAAAGLVVHEYSPTVVKQAVVGTGAATKEQVQQMVKLLLKQKEVAGADASDALAVAICHINHSGAIMTALADEKARARVKARTG
ncbi:MAG: crossover junction endodeoxyribonuclease RuvC [Thermodesulfobacteriota bacterium]